MLSIKLSLERLNLIKQLQVYFQIKNHQNSSTDDDQSKHLNFFTRAAESLHMSWIEFTHMLLFIQLPCRTCKRDQNTQNQYLYKGTVVSITWHYR